MSRDTSTRIDAELLAHFRSWCRIQGRGLREGVEAALVAAMEAAPAVDVRAEVAGLRAQLAHTTAALQGLQAQVEDVKAATQQAQKRAEAVHDALAKKADLDGVRHVEAAVRQLRQRLPEPPEGHAAAWRPRGRGWRLEAVRKERE